MDDPAREMAEGVAPGRWWHALEDGRVECDLCPRHCRLHEGQRAFCFVRQNRRGQMVLTTYGRSTGFCIDPIEKKPLFHFLPGTPVLSFGTAGCNLGCRFCQNWDISKAREVSLLSDRAAPEQVADAALQSGCRSVAFTYNDPVVWAEYAIDTARACRERGIRTVAVTAGYIEPGPREEFYAFMDAANVDLKAFTEQFYHRLAFGHLAPVLDTLRWLHQEMGVWLEITTLLIPEENDSPDEVSRLCDWIGENLGADVPLHFTAYHPDYRFTRPATPASTLARARQQALDRGLHHVYSGNVTDVASQTTYCSACRRPVIGRDWYELGEWHVRGGGCAHCGHPLPGHFEDVPGRWGQRRTLVRIR